MVPKLGRRNSPNLLAFAALWENKSPALYKKILKDNILALPSQRQLKNLTSAFTVEAGLSKAIEKYLKSPILELWKKEKK